MSATPTVRIQRLSLLLLAVAILVSLFVGGTSVVLGVALGGGLAAANFYALRRIVGGLIAGGSGRKLATLTVLLTLKFGVLGVLLYLVITRLPVNPLALLAGISVVVLAIFIEGFRTAFAQRSAAAE